MKNITSINFWTIFLFFAAGLSFSSSLFCMDSNMQALHNALTGRDGLQPTLHQLQQRLKTLAENLETLQHQLHTQSASAHESGKEHLHQGRADSSTSESLDPIVATQLEAKTLIQQIDNLIAEINSYKKIAPSQFPHVNLNAKISEELTMNECINTINSFIGHCQERRKELIALRATLNIPQTWSTPEMQSHAQKLDKIKSTLELHRKGHKDYSDRIKDTLSQPTKLPKKDGENKDYAPSSSPDAPVPHAETENPSSEAGDTNPTLLQQVKNWFASWWS